MRQQRQIDCSERLRSRRQHCWMRRGVVKVHEADGYSRCASRVQVGGYRFKLLPIAGDKIKAGATLGEQTKSGFGNAGGSSKGEYSHWEPPRRHQAVTLCQKAESNAGST